MPTTRIPKRNLNAPPRVQDVVNDPRLMDVLPFQTKLRMAVTQFFKEYSAQYPEVVRPEMEEFVADPRKLEVLGTEELLDLGVTAYLQYRVVHGTPEEVTIPDPTPEVPDPQPEPPIPPPVTPDPAIPNPTDPPPPPPDPPPVEPEDPPAEPPPITQPPPHPGADPGDPTGGFIWVVPSGDVAALQNALNNVSPGEIIELESGGTWVGNFTLRRQPAASTDYISIRPSNPNWIQGSSAGSRPNPENYTLNAMPRIMSPSNAPCLRTEAGAHHYIIRKIHFDHNRNGQGTIMYLGDPTSNQNDAVFDAGDVPHHFYLDRLYITGHPTLGQLRGIALNSADTVIRSCHIRDIKYVGSDSQAICGWNGPGPYLIDDCYLEAAGENVMFGGSDTAITNMTPSDITITGCHFFKPLEWITQSWTVKNLFELKHADRVLVKNNFFENNWLDAQTGWAILFKSVNQYGGNPWAVTQNVSFQHNIVKNVSCGTNLNTYEVGVAGAVRPLPCNNISYYNNLWLIDNTGGKGGQGRPIMTSGIAGLSFINNTFIYTGDLAVFAHQRPNPDFTFNDNILCPGAAATQYGFKGESAQEGIGSGTATGTTSETFTRYFPGLIDPTSNAFLANVMERISSSRHPSSSDPLFPNSFPASKAAILFVDDTDTGPEYDGFALQAGSPYKGASSGIVTPGADPGFDPFLSSAHNAVQPWSL